MTTPMIELKPSASPLAAAEREAILANPGFGRATLSAGAASLRNSSATMGSAWPS